MIPKAIKIDEFAIRICYVGTRTLSESDLEELNDQVQCALNTISFGQLIRQKLEEVGGPELNAKLKVGVTYE